MREAEENTSMNILLTGNKGYIGAVMATYLINRGYTVHGLDCEYFGPECSFGSEVTSVPSLAKDVRDVTEKDLVGIDGVIHLAALCNDPLGNLDSGWTFQINDGGSVHLAKLAKAAGVQRFLLSSSCSMHGASQEAQVTEETPVNPLTPYGLSKIQAEQAIQKLADDTFSPTYLRNGTVYGVSERLRLDIVLNNLVGWAYTTGCVKIMSTGTQWRPVVHVEDVCQAFVAALEAPRKAVHNQVFHVGTNKGNFTIRELAEIAKSAVPGSEVEYCHESGADQRTYIASFDKIEQSLPSFQPRWTPESGAAQLVKAFEEYDLQEADMVGKRYIRLKRMNALLDEGLLDNTLRWKRST